MRTYRELFRAPEFTSLFLVSTLQVAGQTVSGLALGTLIYGATGSPLLSSLAMFGPSLAQLVGATTLLSAADRLPPRATLGGLLLVFAAGTAVQALPGLPVAVTFAVLLVQGVLASLGGGVRYGLLNEVLSKDGYLLGRSVLNMSTGIVQICGYALGGVLVALLEPRGTLLAGRAVPGGRRRRPARPGQAGGLPRATGRVSVAATWRTNALLWSSRPRRLVYLALWVPNGLVVGCESLYVPYAPHHAGLLFACGALGMLAGDTAMGRFVPAHWRRRLPVPMLALLAAPFLLFALRPPLPVAAGLVTVATVGFAASLLLQERLLELTPHELSGHALGLHSSGMLAMQGVGAALAGAVAERTSPATAMTLVGAASLAVTAGLARGLLAPAGHPQPAAPPASTPAAPAPARPPQEPEGRP
ncbi:MFS transporter [Streptomyces albus]